MRRYEEGGALDDAKRDPREVAREAVARVQQVATLPEAASRVIEIVEDPAGTPEELSAAFAGDPALCAQLLRVANSAFYGLRCQVTSVDHAAAVLGQEVVRNVALAASLAPIFMGDGVHAAFSMARLWRHAVGVAAASRLLARRLDVGDPEQAFVAGLIHDVGLVVELQDDRQGLSAVFDAMGFDPEGHPRAALQDAERERFGADHRHFGACLCEKWGLPAVLGTAIEHHHDPLAAPPPERVLPALVHTAERLGPAAEHGFSHPAGEPDAEVLGVLGTDRDTVDGLRDALAEEVSAAESSFAT